MAQYSNLKAYIEEKIYENGTQAITGDILQDVLKVMTDDLGEFYQTGGMASPSTDPGTPDAKVIYFATEAGTYTNFGGITLAAGEVALLIFETSWTKVELNVLSSANGGVKTANLADGAVTTEKIAGGAVETAKIANNAVTSGKVADGAIGTAKIADGAIDADKIAANAVESAKIKNGAVTEGKINDGAVTAGKIASNAVTTDKIKDDAVTSDKIANYAVGSGQLASGAVHAGNIADGAVTAPKIGGGAVTSGKIGSGAVTEEKIADGAVTTSKIADGAVGSDQLAEGAFSAENLADGSVTTDKLADEAVTAEKIADGAVTADKFANGSVTTIKLGSGAVTTEKIGDGMVTRQKLADSSVSTSKIIDGAVTTAKVADANVTTAKIADANVTTGKLADGAVTTAKIADGDVTGAKLQEGVRPVINVNALNEETAAYGSAALARAAVPSALRILGLHIIYLLAGGWFEDEYIGSDVSGWGTGSNWRAVGPVSVSQNTETGKDELKIGDDVRWILDNEPEIDSNNLAKSGSVYAMNHFIGSMEQGYIDTTTKKWTDLSTGGRFYSIIPIVCNGTEQVQAKGSANDSSVLYFLSDYTPVEGGDASVIGGTVISQDTNYTTIIPEGTKYIYLLNLSNTNRIPQKLLVGDIDVLALIKDNLFNIQKELASYETQTDTALNAISKKKADYSDTFLKKDVVFNSGDAEISADLDFGGTICFATTGDALKFHLSGKNTIWSQYRVYLLLDSEVVTTFDFDTEDAEGVVPSEINALKFRVRSSYFIASDTAEYYAAYKGETYLNQLADVEIYNLAYRANEIYKSGSTTTPKPNWFYDTNAHFKKGDILKINVTGLGTVISSFRVYLNEVSTTYTDSEVIIPLQSDVTSIRINVASASVIGTGTVTYVVEKIGIYERLQKYMPNDSIDTNNIKDKSVTLEKLGDDVIGSISETRIPEYLEEDFTYKKDKMEAIMKGESANIAAMSDLHSTDIVTSDNYKYLKKTFNSLSVLSRQIPIDLITLCGDYVTRLSEDSKENGIRVLEKMNEWTADLWGKTMLIAGNHEQVWYGDSQYGLTMDEYMAYVQKKYIQAFGSIIDYKTADYIICHQDDVVNKVRYLYISTFSKNGYDYENVGTVASSNLPEGYGVIVFCHFGIDTFSEGGFDNPEIYNRVKLSIDNIKTKIANVTNAELICWVSGHTHIDSVLVYNNTPVISLLRSAFGNEEGMSQDGNTYIRTAETVTEQTISILTIRKDLGKVYITRFGCGVDIEVNYNSTNGQTIGRVWNTLSGVVYASDGVTPLSSATVTINFMGASYQTTTNASGEYSLTKCPKEKGTIVTALSGYTFADVDINITGDTTQNITAS